jgi:hypothetical protein
MRKILSYIFVSTLLFSCKENDDKVFPVEPFIEFKSLTFKKGLTGYPDSLNLKFYFTDGDSDFGLPGTFASPYNFRNYFFKSNGNKYTGELPAVASSELIRYKDKRLKILDTLPLFTNPFNCTNWELYRSNNLVTDTVYYQANPNFYNLFVDLFTFENGAWIKFNPYSILFHPNCPTADFLNARVPELGNFLLPSYYPFLFERISSKEGVITYRVVSYSLSFLFAGKKIKLKARIQDRALHKSNEIESSEIQL